MPDCLLKRCFECSSDDKMLKFFDKLIIYRLHFMCNIGEVLINSRSLMQSVLFLMLRNYQRFGLRLLMILTYNLQSLDASFWHVENFFCNGYLT